MENSEQLVFIWFAENDDGQKKDVIKIYAVASSLSEARRRVLSVPGTGNAIRSIVEKSPTVVCGTPFAEVNISANGKVASAIQAERRG